MGEVDEGCLMSRMGVSQRMFLLASSGLRAVKRWCVCVFYAVLIRIWFSCQLYSKVRRRCLLPNLNALVAVSTGMRAVKLCILSWWCRLTQVDLYNGGGVSCIGGI